MQITVRVSLPPSTGPRWPVLTLLDSLRNSCVLAVYGARGGTLSFSPRSLAILTLFPIIDSLSGGRCPLLPLKEFYLIFCEAWLISLGKELCSFVILFDILDTSF